MENIFTFLSEITINNVSTSTTQIPGLNSSCENSFAQLENNSNSSSNSQLTKIVTRIAYGYVSPVIISFGIFGDLMTIFILLHPLLRKTSVIYSYLIALAITDLLTLLSVIPMILWILDIKFCSVSAAVYYAHIGFPLANAFMSSSVWIVVSLTLGQYVAVCHPFSRRLKSKKLCLYLTVLAYVLSFSIYVPWGWKKYVRSDLNQTSCPIFAEDNRALITSTWFEVYQWTRELISRLIPFVLVAFFNIRILYVYRATSIDRLSRVSCSQQRSLAEKTEQQEKQLWMLLVGIITVFFVCTIPAAPMTVLVNDKWKSHFSFQVIRAITNVLEFTKFALNFYFYCMINPDIRNLAIHRLTCRPYDNPKFSRRSTRVTNTAYYARANSAPNSAKNSTNQLNRNYRSATCTPRKTVGSYKPQGDEPYKALRARSSSPTGDAGDRPLVTYVSEDHNDNTSCDGIEMTSFSVESLLREKSEERETRHGRNVTNGGTTIYSNPEVVPLAPNECSFYFEGDEIFL